jgi:hypothetical protein
MKDDCAAKKGVIDINVNIFQDALAKIFGFER